MSTSRRGDSKEEFALPVTKKHESSNDLLSSMSSAPSHGLATTFPDPLTETESSFGNNDFIDYLLGDESEQSADREPSSPASTSLDGPTLAPISTVANKPGIVDSSRDQSLDPSPVSTDPHSSHTSDTLVESEADEHGPVFETLLERRRKMTISTVGSPKRLSVVSLTSPTKVLRESHFPASLEKTVRPAPSPLYDEGTPRSASPMSSASSSSSNRPSWADVSKKTGKQKVPFGFRQSLLLDRAQSSRSQSPRSARNSLFSDTSMASRQSLTLPPQPLSASRFELGSNRARSVSPASFTARPPLYRDSLTSRSSSASLRNMAFANHPRSASQLEYESNINRARSVSPAMSTGSDPSSSRPPSWVKPLRLSRVNSPSPSDSQPSPSLSHRHRFSSVSILSSPSHLRSVSQGSFVDSNSHSSARSSLISAYLNDSNIPTHDSPPVNANDGSQRRSVNSDVHSSAQPDNTRQGGVERAHRRLRSNDSDGENAFNIDLLSPLSGSMRGFDFDELSRGFESAGFDRDVLPREPSLRGPYVSVSAPASPPAPISVRNSYTPPIVSSPAAKSTPTTAPISSPSHAIATPRPTLIFAIASDDPAEVERVLSSGEARPNEDVGPQSALEFALTNDQLANRTEIVKTLLAFGADPSALPEDLRNVHNQHTQDDVVEEEDGDVLTDLPSDPPGATTPLKSKKRESVLNPAMKYYLNRATAAGPQSAQTSAALRRSDFRPLARMRFDFVGQDRALEHLYWVLGMHSQQPIGTPLVVLCCGPSGHGKSLLARKFGSLLDVPTHTVNMTILKTSHDLWQCPSMSPYDPPSERTLAEFLEENAGKRCVVVLDEIDKNEDERTLWSLLAPWELGRCSIDAGRRHIDVRNVIWLGTSNIGQDLVFEHHASRKDADTIISKAEYRDLMNLLRPRVTERLGTSLMSRVTAVLPFVPFTPEERLAIASEAIIALGGEMAAEFTTDDFERIAARCVSEYVSTDGARSLYRNVSTHLMEAF
ncbi:hypothetical protein DFH11DRAFT_1579357 [Phellopilus nigrolimitatus]|nr:hypothetical protein DFH11DRAFT_1579357 [Phellopilus nigrolimitatus]